MFPIFVMCTKLVLSSTKLGLTFESAAELNYLG